MGQKQYAVRPNKLIKGMSNLLWARCRCAATTKAIRRWWLQSNTPLMIAKQYTAGLGNNTSAQSNMLLVVNNTPLAVDRCALLQRLVTHIKYCYSKRSFWEWWGHNAQYIASYPWSRSSYFHVVSLECLSIPLRRVIEFETGYGEAWAVRCTRMGSSDPTYS